MAAYGDGWWVWDEAEIVRLRARDLIALEELVGLPIVEIMAGARRDLTMPKLAAMWIAMHRAGHPVAWADFDPAVHATTWEAAPEPPLDSGEDPAPAAASSTVVAAPESATS